jgi:DNA (cytosine-5)-methyltransferase 1
MSCSGLGFYEFFAGAGLVRLGLGHQWRCLWANDIDPRKADVYMANFDKSEFLLGDVALVRASSLPIGSHLAWASFPCQDLSLAGWRQGMSGDRSGTFWAFWRIMRDLYDDERRPPIIVIENVAELCHKSGLLSIFCFVALVAVFHFLHSYKSISLIQWIQEPLF